MITETPETPNVAPPEPAPSQAFDPQIPATPGHQPSTINHEPSPGSQLSTLNSQPTFPLLPGETPRAFAAFMAFFQLGHIRSHNAVADLLGEKPRTVRNWASRCHWNERIAAFQSGLLDQQVQAEADARRKQAADWANRSNQFREQKWAAAQKLLAATQCFLDSFGDQEVEKMTLGQVARALQISSRLAAEALANPGPQESAMAPFQVEFEEALQRVYGQPLPQSPEPPNLNPVPAHSSANAGQLATSE
jgi:hypothetical protein